MKTLWDELRPLLRYIAAFPFSINLLFLVPAMVTLQVFDRVVSSNSRETLVVLLAGTAVALFILLLLDYVRDRLQNVLRTSSATSSTNTCRRRSQMPSW
jgi:ATP-binding cassette subfamily C exporter for protease/lipase/ATP-binding cassette subfamily C protein EexD